MKAFVCLFKVCCIFLFVTFISCLNEEEVYYSCDSFTDAWVKDNLPMIRKMNRQIWLTYPDSLSIPIYRAFTPEQKQRVWLEKLKEVIDRGGWSQQEYAHLVLMDSTLRASVCWFSDEGIENNQLVYEEYKIFMYKWLRYCLDELKWNRNLILNIAFTGKSLPTTKNSGFIDEIAPTPDKKSDCDCKKTNVLFTTCSGILSCSSGPCEETSHGCGAFLVEGCDGLCVPR